MKTDPYDPKKTIPADQAAARWAVPVVYLLFFLSGFCGLVYEVIWMRRFAVSFGNTTYAVTVVLAAFMGGLALGSRWFGLAVDRPGRKAMLLSYYGWMEIGVGAYCLAFDKLVELQDSLLLWFYHSFDPSMPASLTVKFILSLLLLLAPTILMGGTLPVLIKSLSRSLPDVGRVTAKVYFINSSGAVLGTLAVAFWMIPAMGMALSTAVAAAVNIGVGVFAIYLRRFWSEEPGVARAASAEIPDKSEAFAPADPAGHRALKWALAAIFISGFTAMVYEVAWTRLLSMVLGSSTYSFSLMLAAFISGIALGSYLISRWMDRIKSPAFVFALSQLAIAVAVLAMLPLYSRLPLFFIWCRELVNFSYEAHQVFKFGFSLLVMLVPATAFGMGFPLVSRMAAGELGELAGKVGGVYALNTLGNILGSVAAGLVMIQFLGLKLSMEVTVLLNLAAGGAILFSLGKLRSRKTVLILAACSAALVFYLALTPGWDIKLLTGGVFRYHPSKAKTGIEKYRKEVASHEILFYREGISATVSVEKSAGYISLRVNGKVDASSGGDMNTQLLLAHLPMLLHERPANVLVIGVGSGVTCGAALAHPELKNLCCVEISPSVIEGSRFFEEYNRRYWEDERTKIVIDDGRNYLFRTTTKWDLITSEPSNPWMAGIGNLYTVKFYQDCRKALAPGGIICQWIHIYEIDEDVLKTIFRTFIKIFPRAVAFSSLEGSDILLIGSRDKLSDPFGRLAGRMRVQAVADDLERAGIKNVFTFLSTQIFDSRSMFRWAGIGPLNTDNSPIVEYTAPRGFFNRESVILPEKYRLGQGRTLLSRYLRSHEVSADELLEQARYLAQFSRTKFTNLVYSALADALALEPDHAEALIMMAELLIAREKYGEVPEILEKLAALGESEKVILALEYPVASALSGRRAASFVNPPDYTRAIEIKRRLAELEPSRSIHPFQMGETYERTFDYRTAAKAFETALGLRGGEEEETGTPEKPNIIHRIANCYLQAGDFDLASYWYNRLNREYPDNPLGTGILKLIIIEKLLSEGREIDIESLRRALEK